VRGAATGAAPANRAAPVPDVEASGARKVMTIIFGDPVGPTALHERPRIGAPIASTRAPSTGRE
jgi:hypothetical protein